MLNTRLGSHAAKHVHIPSSSTVSRKAKCVNSLPTIAVSGLKKQIYKSLEHHINYYRLKEDVSTSICVFDWYVQS